MKLFEWLVSKLEQEYKIFELDVFKGKNQVGQKKSPTAILLNTTSRLPGWSFKSIGWVVPKLGQKYEIFELDGLNGKNRVGQKFSPTAILLDTTSELPNWSFTSIGWVLFKLGQKYENFELNGLGVKIKWVEKIFRELCCLILLQYYRIEVSHWLDKWFPS